MRTNSAGTAQRDRILECVIRQLSELGFNAVTFGGVARELGISKGLISYHFPQRDDLMAAAVEKIMGDFAAWVSAPVDEASAADDLRTLVMSVLKYASEHTEQMAALLEVGDHWRSLGRPGLAAPWRRAALEAIEGILRAGQAADSFAAFDCRVAAMAIQAMLDAQVVAWRVSPPRDPALESHALADLIDRMVRK